MATPIPPNYGGGPLNSPTPASSTANRHTPQQHWPPQRQQYQQPHTPSHHSSHQPNQRQLQYQPNLLQSPTPSVASSMGSTLGPVGCASPAPPVPPAPPGGPSLVSLADELRQNANFCARIMSPWRCAECDQDHHQVRTRGRVNPSLIHLVCPNGSNRVLCRGCRRIVRCPRDCPGRHGCHVKRCCSEARTVAIFEYLAGFDQGYLDCVRAVHSRNGTTPAALDPDVPKFVDAWLHAPNRATFEFASLLRRTLRAIHFWSLPSDLSNVCLPEVVVMVKTSFFLGVVCDLSARNEEIPGQAGEVQELVRLWSRHHSFADSIVMAPMPVITLSQGLTELLSNANSPWEIDYPLETFFQRSQRLQTTYGNAGLPQPAAGDL